MAVPNCPICDRPLEPLVVLRGDTPPWNCPYDSRSFWEAELEGEWDPYHRSELLEEAIEVELNSTILRGFSFNDNSVEHIPQGTLDKVASLLEGNEKCIEALNRMRGRP